MRAMRYLVALILSCLSLAACRCDPPADPIRLGELGIVVDGVTTSDATVDFGQVAMGLTGAKQIELINRGSGVLDLTGITFVSGEPVKIGDTDTPGAVFTIEAPPTTLGPGESTTLDLTFLAPVSAEMSTDHTSALSIALGNSELTMAGLTLKGRAVQGQCLFPAEVDFGAVQVDDTSKQSRPISNTSPLLATATIEAITSLSGDHTAFGFAPESEKGSFDIPAGAMRNVVFTFKPTAAREWLATVSVKAAAACPPVITVLKGTGVDLVLVCEPNLVEFGFASPMSSKPGEAKIRNLGLAPVPLTGVATRVGSAASTEFLYTGATSLEVPAGGTLTVPLTFRPAVLGARQGTLVANTPLAKQPMLSCPLRGSGGGPDIDVTPAQVNVGRIAYFAPPLAPSVTTRKVTIRNVGALPMNNDPEGNLKLGKPGSAVWWEVTPKNAQTVAGDLCVGEYDPMATTPCTGRLPLAYDPAVGLRAEATALLDVPLRVQPSAAGLAMEWDVIFHSNDPDEPQFTVNVRATSVALPPCQYTVSPASVSFGLMSAPSVRDQGIAVTNQGTQPNEVCLISSFDLAPGTDPLFKLPAGAVTDFELQPGQSTVLLVRAQATANGSSVVNVTGNAVLQISSPTAPSRQIPLAASLGPSCLVLSPASVDFGTVKRGCGSQRRSINAYNACNSTLTIQSFSIIAAAGQPAGGPDCPGMAACPEFTIDGAPVNLTLNAGAAASLPFSFRYRPIDVGPDTGAFVVRVNQQGDNVDYVVQLGGTGDLVGTQTDSWRQTAVPKSDVLLVIDDSCSMLDDQMALASNFASFIAGASFSGVNVDFNMGVITTDVSRPTTGILIGDSANPKILRRDTPNLQALFASKVVVGTSGGSESIAAPALRAVTAPFVINENAGFLRDDAHLAIIGITDEPDQSPLPDALYAAQLLAAKNGRTHLISYNIIGPGSMAPCGGDEAVSTHDFLTAFFNGVRGEICQADWSMLLADVAKPAFGFRDTFFLTSEPDEVAAPIVVKIDSGMGAVTVPRTTAGGTPIWRYDAMTGSVIFTPGYVPDPGTLLTISYTPICH
ncbi:MAG: choice-of-anchor D domain-containing protein [Myxococcaceae bacterium]|nr:choice-of-anchor D domain-containing protein [Myxococcaceae bacterium]